MKSKNKHWTHEEDSIIKANYGKATFTDILKLLPGRGKNSVRLRASRLHSTKKIKKDWSQEELDILIREYANNPNIFALLPQREKVDIIRKANEISLKLNHRSKKYIFDPYFFENMTEKSAYTVGFIAADGHLRFDRNCVVISIHKKDVEILHKILFAMNSNANISFGKTRETATISITSSKLLEDLFSILYVKNQKSFLLGEPNISDKYAKDFIRGYFDGDGSVKNKVKHIQFLGTFKLLEWINNQFTKNLSIINKIPKKKGNIFKLEYTGNNAIKILDWIYSDSTIYLDRKYQRYVILKNRSVKTLNVVHPEIQDEDIVGSTSNSGA